MYVSPSVVLYMRILAYYIESQNYVNKFPHQLYIIYTQKPYIPIFIFDTLNHEIWFINVYTYVSFIELLSLPYSNANLLLCLSNHLYILISLMLPFGSLVWFIEALKWCMFRCRLFSFFNKTTLIYLKTPSTFPTFSPKKKLPKTFIVLR